jgi:hypothetical protein
MKELLKEINNKSYSDKIVKDQCITLEDLHKILSRYEVVSKELNQPYTT